MPPDTPTRERLAQAQAALMGALCGEGAVPAGFARAGVLAEAATLARKRQGAVAKGRPALARALGRHFGEHFAAYAREQRRPASIRADEAGFARWFMDRLGDEEVLLRIDWRVGLSAFTAASARAEGSAELSPQVRADLAQFQEILAAVHERRGPQATEEPRLKAVLVVASLGVIGVDVDGPTRVLLRRELADMIRASTTEGTCRPTGLARVLSTVRSNLAVEEVLSRRLTLDQRERYLAHTGEAPPLDQGISRRALRGSSAEALGERLAQHWAEVFQLQGSDALAAAHEVALRYGREAFPLASTLLPDAAVARRGARLHRAACLLSIQQRTEEDLAAHPRLSATERARVEAGLGAWAIDVECDAVPR